MSRLVTGREPEHDDAQDLIMAARVICRRAKAKTGGKVPFRVEMIARVLEHYAVAIYPHAEAWRRLD